MVVRYEHLNHYGRHIGRAIGPPGSEVRSYTTTVDESAEQEEGNSKSRTAMSTRSRQRLLEGSGSKEDQPQGLLDKR